MPIVENDLVFRMSTKSGAAGDTTASTPAECLGKYVSTTAIDLVTTLHNLFDIVSSAESSAGDTEYRCYFVLNNHGTLTLTAGKVWLQSEVAGGANIAIGLDPAGPTPKGQAPAQAAEIADESSAPAGVTFSSPVSKATGLSMSDLPAGQVQAIWVRRTVPASTAAANNDGVTLRVEGDTAA